MRLKKKSEKAEDKTKKRNKTETKNAFKLLEKGKKYKNAGNTCSIDSKNMQFPNYSDEKTAMMPAKRINIFDEFDIGEAQVIGTRSVQQDAMITIMHEEAHAVTGIVCDGMGGLNGGEIASRTVIECMYNELDKIVGNENFPDMMETVIKNINETVKALKDKDGNPLNAGTTLSMVVVKDDRLHCFSVGDSKVYLQRKGQLMCLTNEHNYAYMSEVKKNDNTFKPNPNAKAEALVSYLGAPQVVYIDRYKTPPHLMDGDRIMICSDGLYKLLKDNDIKRIMADELADAKTIANKLIEEATDNVVRAQDNTTVILMKYNKNKKKEEKEE